MSTDDDWRLMGQERYLEGARLRLATYRQPRPDWDHDHCAFCTVKIMEGDHPDTLQEAYVTEDGQHWVCPSCFEEFKEQFAWTIVQ